MQNKFAWISTPDEIWDDKKEMITTALESGIDYVLDLEDSENIRTVGNFNIISTEEDADIYLVGIDGEGDGTLELKDNLNESSDLAKAKEAKNLVDRDTVDIIGTIKFEYRSDYGGEGPVLYADICEKVPPMKDPIVNML